MSITITRRRYSVERLVCDGEIAKLILNWIMSSRTSKSFRFNKKVKYPGVHFHWDQVQDIAALAALNAVSITEIPINAVTNALSGFMTSIHSMPIHVFGFLKVTCVCVRACVRVENNKAENREEPKSLTRFLVTIKVRADLNLVLNWFIPNSLW